MKLTLTFVKRTQKTSQRTGKPFTSLSIKCNEYGDKYLSGFDGKETASWNVGDTVEVEIEPKGEYLNFSVPRAPRANSAPPAGVPSYSEDKLLRELRALNVKADKTYEVLCDLMKKLLKKGVIELEDVPFPTNEDFDKYGK